MQDYKKLKMQAKGKTEKKTAKTSSCFFAQGKKKIHV
jgi:hypothetical protein